jgi:hypothetical protein
LTARRDSVAWLALIVVALNTTGLWQTHTPPTRVAIPTVVCAYGGLHETDLEKQRSSDTPDPFGKSHAGHCPLCARINHSPALLISNAANFAISIAFELWRPGAADACLKVGFALLRPGPRGPPLLS